MRPDAARRWRVWLAVAGALAAITMLGMTERLQTLPPDLGEVVLSYGLLTATVVFALVGVRIVAHDARHSVGWLLLLIAVSFSASSFAGPYMVDVADRLPVLLLHLGGFAWFFAFGALLSLLMVMPTGRLLSRAWRLPLYALWGAMVPIAAAGLTHPLILPTGRVNPLSAPAVYAIAEPLQATVAPVLVVVGVLGGLAALVVRFRRSVAGERQQLKWLLFGGGLLAVGLAVSVVGELVGASLSAGASGLGVAALPICCGVAIVRHRLFDIDRVVTRTLSYAVLTTLLVGVYAGSVVALRTVLAPLAPDSDIAVAGSTLVVAALFGPVRRRVQLVVDRRFNRQRYDAARAVEAFGQRLRDEVDLDEVATELRATTARTVEPATVDLWLMPGRVAP